MDKKLQYPKALVTNIPDRWTAYESMGRQISGTRLLACKTPLTEETCWKLNGRDPFTPRTLMDHCSSLGLVVDLTFKKPGYYKSQDFEDQGIHHIKLAIPGREVPKNNDVYRFFQVIEEFLKENEDNDKTIAVHCTHGLNRTGYMICRYMIECLNVPADQAILDFDSARGHKQERENYLRSLRRTLPGTGYVEWLQAKNKAKAGSSSGSTPRRSDRDAHLRRKSFREDQGKSRKRSLDELDMDSNYGDTMGAPSAKRRRFDSSANYHRPSDSEFYRSPDRNQQVRFYGQDYYHNYYRGPVNQQYTMDFYRTNQPSPYNLRNKFEYPPPSGDFSDFPSPGNRRSFRYTRRSRSQYGSNYPRYS